MDKTLINVEKKKTVWTSINSNMPENPRIIELVGLAGAGKTTIAQKLNQLTEHIVLKEHPYFRAVPDIPFFIWNTILMIPTFMEFYFNKNGDRYFTLREMAWMVILNGWWKKLKMECAKSNVIMIIDQGPISLMAELSAFGPKCLLRSVGQKWWLKVYANWAKTLDLLICMDTEDPTLIHRVRTRNRWHLIKEINDDGAYEFNHQFRVLNKSLVKILTQKEPALCVIYIDTGLDTLEENVSKIAGLLQLGLI